MFWTSDLENVKIVEFKFLDTVLKEFVKVGDNSVMKLVVDVNFICVLELVISLVTGFDDKKEFDAFVAVVVVVDIFIVEIILVVFVLS